MAGSIQTHFADLPDPRSGQGRRHLLSDMLSIAICAVACGAEGWADIELFGRSKLRWFETFLALPHGVPSHDTFARVFSRLDPDAFERCFLAWGRSLAQSSGGRLIAIDGKTLRRSFAHAWDKRALHLVGAFASANGLVLGQVATDAKSNEITAIPALLELLDLKGATVTIDAMGCQREIAAKIVECGGDYVLAVKDNQPTLHAKVKRLLDDLILDHAKGVVGARVGFCERTDDIGNHGRVETRRAWATDEVEWLGRDLLEQWPGLAGVAAVESRRQDLGDLSGKVTTERRYFISSHAGLDASLPAAAVRGHWAVENRLHWVLDVTFDEDQCRIRKDHGPENFSRLRRISLNLLRQEKSLNASVRGKRLKAGWDRDYLLKVLQA